MLIQASKVSKSIGGVPLFDEMSLTIQSNEKIGLVGSNGCGKTTFLKLLSGLGKADSGTISKKKELKIGYVRQEQIQSEDTVLAYVLGGFKQIRKLKNLLTALETELVKENADVENLLLRYGRLQDEFESAGGFSIEDRTISVLKGLGLGNQMNQPVNALSGGERVRLEMVKLLVSDSDLLLLDEPTNHLDLVGITWLENYLKNTKKAVMIISHDREVLDVVTQKIIEIEDGKLREYKGNYSVYQKLKKDYIEQLQKDYDLQQKEIARMKKLARQFRQWGNEGDNEKFFIKAKEIEHRLERIEQIKPPIIVKKRLQKEIAQKEKTGKEVVCVENLGKLMGDRILFDAASFKIYSGERIALTGQNGSGKSTLLKILIGQIEADEGSVKTGASVSMAYLPQNISFEQPEIRLVQYASQLIGNEQKARQELARFGFYAGDVSKRLKDLSGGEKVRLYLMELFQKKINFLILDEPTNHLDIQAREEIEGILRQYQGTLLTVSHDRYFLKQNFQETLSIADGKIVKYDELKI